MKKWAITIGLCALLVQGCAATQLAGQAVRSGIKDIEFNVTNGYNIKDFANSKIAISTNVGNERSEGIAALAMLTGRATPDTPTQATNNVYTDMIMTEFLKQGYDTRAVADSFNAANPSDIETYKSQGYQVVVTGNLKVESSSSAWGSVTGGGSHYSGVKEFSLKGIDTSTGKIIFIVTGSYGNPKEAKVVATDIAKAFNKQIKG